MIDTQQEQAKNAFRDAIAQGLIPQYLYKYTSVENCLKIIKDGTVYFADYHMFNDPFECKAIIDTNNTYEEWLYFFHRNGVPIIDASKRALEIANNPKVAKQVIESSVMKQMNHIGFLCLTGKYDNLLMWAHYAQQHEGCCVKFDICNDVDLFFRIKAVVYNDNYLCYNYLRNHDGALETICHKSKDWDYEEEYRIMNFNGNGLKKMKPGTVKEVYLGCRIKDCDRRVILDSVASTINQPGISVYQALTNDKAFKLDFMRV